MIRLHYILLGEAYGNGGAEEIDKEEDGKV